MNSRTRFTRIAALAAMLALSAAPAHALKVVTWNMLQYPQTNLAARQPAFRTILAALDPDVLITQEMDTADSRDSLLNNVLNVVEPGQWTGAWIQLGGEGGAFFWKPAKVSIPTLVTIATGGPRPVMVGVVKPVGYASNKSWFRLYSIHLKAGTATPATTDSMTRRLECTSLRNTLNTTNTVSVGTNFLLAGDSNFYGSWEGGYQRLTESQANNNGRCFDPFSMPGTWNSNSAYAIFDTQCPCLTGCGPGQSGGGLDDRFDIMLESASLRDGTGLDLVPGGCYTYGNDGNHFNTDINAGGFNTAVGLTIANALHDASDHMPVVTILQLPAQVAGESQLAFGDVIVGATASNTFHLSNVAVAPADSLRATLAAPAGFSAAAGPYALAAGAAAPVAVTMNTATPAAYATTLTVTSNDVDTTAKSVLLSGRVLAHAVASLDSAAVVTAASVDLGVHPAAAFPDAPVRVFDQGWNALQARLVVSAANIAGGNGRFSIVGGFSPATIGSPGNTWSVHFDPTGATLDSAYTATLTFTTADEALPGGAAASPLTVALTATLSNQGLAVGDGPTALRFLPPRPNPLHDATEIAFDLPSAAPVELGIFDLGGRRVASLASGMLGAGHHSLRWNTQDAAGRAVPAGLYFARFSTPGLTRVARLAVLP